MQIVRITVSSFQMCLSHPSITSTSELLILVRPISQTLPLLVSQTWSCNTNGTNAHSYLGKQPFHSEADSAHIWFNSQHQSRRSWNNTAWIKQVLHVKCFVDRRPSSYRWAPVITNTSAPLCIHSFPLSHSGICPVSDSSLCKHSCSYCLLTSLTFRLCSFFLCSLDAHTHTQSCIRWQAPCSIDAAAAAASSPAP